MEEIKHLNIAENNIIENCNMVVDEIKKSFFVKIVNHGKVFGDTYNWLTFYCGNCGSQLLKTDNVCNECGSTALHKQA